MPEEPSLSLRITPAESDVDLAEVEELAFQLRQDLLASGVPGVAREVAGPAPAGTRSVELIVAGLGFLVTGLSTAASAAQLADFVQRWREQHPRRRRVKVAVVAGHASPQKPAGIGRRSALLVANAAYQDPGLSQLRSPVSDIRALAEVLGEPSIGAFEVDTITDAGEATLRRRVAAFFADRNPDDVLLLHFSCHGLKDQRGRLFLAAADTELSFLTATGLPASFVSEQMSETASRSVLLILDCCYSGAFARDTVARADRTVHLADEFRGGGTGRTVLTASSATEYSFEGGQITTYEAQPSVFTDALVRGLRTGSADLDHDGEISVDELFEFASQRVREAQVGQVPRKWAFDTTGPLVVARSVRPALLPEEIRSDLASDRRVLRLEAVRALAGLLAGSREGYRQAARVALTDLRDNDDSVQVRAAAAAALSDAPALAAPGAELPSTPTATPPPATSLEATPRPANPSAMRAEPSPPAVTPLAVFPTIASPPPATPLESPPRPAGPSTVSATPPDAASAAPRAGTPQDAGPRLGGPRPEGAPPTEHGAPQPVQEPGPRRRNRILAIVAIGLVVVTAVTIGIISQLADQDHGESGSTGPPSFGAAIGNTTLSDDRELDSAQLSPGGKWAVTLGKTPTQAAAQTAQLWNVTTGAKTATFDTEHGVVFSPDATVVASTSFTGKRDVSTGNGTPMGLMIGGDTVVELRDTATGAKLATLSGHEGSAYIAFSPDSKIVATAGTLAAEKSFDSPVRLWEALTGKPLGTLSGHDNGIQSMSFSPDGKLLVSSAAGGTTKIWDVATRTAAATLPKVWFPQWISPDGKTFAARKTDRSFELRSLPWGNLIANVTDAGEFAGFNADGSAYATATAAGTVRLYAIATQKNPIGPALTTAIKGDLIFSPDGRLIAAVDKDSGDPAVFDAITGQGLMPLSGHTGTVTDMVFAQGGEVLVTTGTDKTVRRWWVHRVQPTPSG